MTPDQEIRAAALAAASRSAKREWPVAWVLSVANQYEEYIRGSEPVAPPEVDLDAFYCSGHVKGAQPSFDGCGHPRARHFEDGCHAPGSDDTDLCPCERVYGE